MSAITRSGWSALSVVTKWWPARSASSFPRKKRSTPQSRIVATFVSVTRSGPPSDARDFFQGLVHVAVAWYQAGRGNRTGCERQLAKAARRLGPYVPAHRGVDVAGIVAQVA